MTIWVDADACPVPIRDMLCRAAERAQVLTVFVANSPLRLPPSKFLQMKTVPRGFDVADNEIVALVQTGDLVVTQDIPLAFEVIEKGAQAVGPRGEAHDKDNIKQRLTMRDFFETLRASGVQTAGPSALSPADKQKFAAMLDKYLQQRRG